MLATVHLDPSQLQLKILHLHSCEPLVLLALEMSVLANAEKCLRPKRSFISLLDTVAKPPGSSLAGSIQEQNSH